MKIIKRNGSEVEFDKLKIIEAVKKANAVVDLDKRLIKPQIEMLADKVELACRNMGRAVNVEEIQDMVENHIMKFEAFEVARK